MAWGVTEESSVTTQTAVAWVCIPANYFHTIGCVMWWVVHTSRLDDAINAAMEVIDKATKEHYERARDVNEKKIQLKCSDIQRRAEVGKYLVGVSMGE